MILSRKIENRLILLSAFLSGLSLPGNQLGLLSFVSYAPLFYVLINTKNLNFKSFFWLGYKFSFVFVLVSMYWIAYSDISGFVGAQITICLRFSILFGFIYFIRKYKLPIFTLAFLFVIHEYLYTKTELDYPWHMIAYALTDVPSLIQISEITGIYGVSFFIYFLNILIAKSFSFETFTIKKFLPILFIILSYLFINFSLLLLLDSKNVKAIKVGIVQPNIDPFMKWEQQTFSLSINRLLASTYESINQGSDHIIWPETAMPYRLRHSKNMIKKLHMLADTFQVNLTIGTIDDQNINKQTKSFNSAFHFLPNHTDFIVYNKRRLVPVIEKKVYDGLLDFVNNLPGMAGFELGKKKTVISSQNKIYAMRKDSYFTKWEVDTISFTKDSIRFATTICIESNYPEIYRDFAEKGKIDLYNILTNDGWFFPHYAWFRSLAKKYNFSPYLKGKAAFQHNRIAIMRAIENRTSIIRSANTGVSSIIDFYGNILKKTSQYEEDLICSYVPINPNSRQTIFQRFGDWFVYLSFAVIFLNIILGFGKKFIKF